jgi:carbon monoxide dehydrogenase subunit G
MAPDGPACDGGEEQGPTQGQTRGDSVSNVAQVPRRPVFVYRREFEFAVPPVELWERIERVDQFERWWPWLQEFRLEGDTLATGSVLHGVVVPPLPYRMRIRVELTGCEPPHLIEADIGGDLQGQARLRVRADGTGSRVEVAWTVEMMQRPMRLASRFGWPLLQWGHDRVVEMTVNGFRRRLEPGG